MSSVFCDSGVGDAERLGLLDDGQLFVASRRPSELALCAFARSLVRRSFAPNDLWATDLERIPEELVLHYDDPPPTPGELVYQRPLLQDPVL